MKTFRDYFEEVFRNKITAFGTDRRTGPWEGSFAETDKALRRDKFKKSEHLSHSGQHYVYSHISKEHAEHVWVNKDTGQTDFTVDAEYHTNKKTGEHIYKNLDTQKGHNGVRGLGKHAYMDIWTGRTAHGPAVTVHDNMSEGASKLMHSIRNHPNYGKRVTYHTHNTYNRKASLDLRGSIATVSNYRKLNTQKDPMRAGLGDHVASTKIVAFVPPYLRKRSRSDAR